MDKMCGNCGRDHKFVNCPYIEKRVLKTEWKEFRKNEEIIDKIKKHIFAETGQTNVLTDWDLKQILGEN